MAGVVKKKIIPGAIGIDLDELCITVQYVTQEVEVDSDGNNRVLSSQPNQKRVRVRSLTGTADIAQVAQEIVDKCKLIHPSKELLYELRDRQADMHSRQPDMQSYQDRPEDMHSRTEPEAHTHAFDEADRQELWQRNQEHFGGAGASSSGRGLELMEIGVLERLEEYIEDLYDEDMRVKVRAVARIATLFKEAENSEHLLSHETLLPTLARILKEDGRRSMDLCIHVTFIFFSLSNFSGFHPLVCDNQVGAITMDLIDLEVRRMDHWENRTKLAAARQKQDRLLYICFYLLLNLAENPEIERKMAKKTIVGYLVRMLKRSDTELLILAVAFLKKLSIYKENKACTVGDTELLILAVAFLKKLSIYKENKDRMAQSGLVGRLLRHMLGSKTVLQMAVLRLLHNLSFDGGLRDDMVRQGVIAKAVGLLRHNALRTTVLGLLYHLSLEDRHKAIFTYTEVLPLVHDMLLEEDDLRSAPELIALAVNLTQTARNAEVLRVGQRLHELVNRALQTEDELLFKVLCAGQRLHELVNRALQTEDELLFKVLRNISQHDDSALRSRMGPCIDEFVTLMKRPNLAPELFVEVLGCLANLAIPGFDYLEVIQKHDLLTFLLVHTQVDAVEDDILLEAVMFTGTLCVENTAPLLVQAGLVTSLYDLMSLKKEDDEIVLQITVTFQTLLRFEATRAALLTGCPHVVNYLVDLLQDRNEEVAKAADQALDLIMDLSEDSAIHIRKLKFEAHNQDWLDLTMRGALSNPQHEALGPGEVPVGGYSDVDDPYQGMGMYVGEDRVMGFDEYHAAQAQQWGGHYDGAAYASGPYGIA
ncbi:hypothetical protein WJX72_007765 [[Myrmecia] bisecta]|uniref:Kinesin-associated protein 3 n=1 Tax=[Myrmecia] bisecta TaxID=41462 RepID=A0AAW1R884_9CHLO